MAQTVLVTDSSTCLPEDLAEHVPVCIVPIMVHLDGRTWVDGSLELLERVYAALETEEPVAADLIRSEPPSPPAYLRAVEAGRRRFGARDAVIVTPAAEFTPMAAAAAAAASLSDHPVGVVDSRTAAAAQALVVLAGARAAARGAVAAEVLAELEDAARRADLVALVRSGSRLEQAGHLPGGSSVPHAVFRMRAGAIETLEAVSSQEEGLERVVSAWQAGARSGGGERAVFHAGAPEAASWLAERLEPVSLNVGFSAAMAIHTGPGVVGAAWLA